MNQSSPDEADSAEELKVESTLVQRFPATNLQVLAHFYRGELARANVWRQRMDATTHWAVVSTMAIISLAYSNQEASVLLLPFCWESGQLLPSPRPSRIGATARVSRPPGLDMRPGEEGAGEER